MTPITRLRRAHPYLTPPFVDEEPEMTRPRVVDPEPVPMEAMTRARRTQPRDVLADESKYLSDLQSGMTAQNPMVRKPSKLQTALGFAASFLQGGLPGAAMYGIQRFNPATYQNAEIGATEDRIGQEVQRRKLQNQLENDQSMRMYRGAQAEKMSRPADPKYGFIPNPNDPSGSDVYSPLTPGMVRPVRKTEPKDSAFNISPGQERVVVGLDGQPHVVYSRPDRPKAENDSRDVKRSAAESELQQLTADEQTAAAEKDRAYAVLAQLKGSGADPSDIRQAASDAARADGFYKSFGAKKIAAHRRVNENAAPRGQTAARPTGRKPKSDPLGLF